MKKIYLLPAILFLFLFPGRVSAQDSIPNRNQTIVYSFFINVVPNGFNFPLIGFINIAKGDHQGLQAGFVNTNERNFDGVQTGFVNTTGGSMKGVEAGFVNTVGRSMEGVQTGFVNTVGKDAEAAQIGFVNTTGGTNEGVQVGFVNTSGKKMKGLQTGFVNTTKKMEGFQLGFVNYADSLEQGIPLGFISIVKYGGHKSVELSTNEMYPANLSVRLGVQYLYSIISAGYNPQLDDEFAFGFGLGSLLPFSEKLFFNPEIMAMDNSDIDLSQLYTFMPQLGFVLHPDWHLVLGPTLSWQYKQGPEQFREPLFTLYEDRLDLNNRLLIGLKAGVRFVF